MKKDFGEFKKLITNKNVALLGIGVSNRPLGIFLSKLGAKVTYFDKKEANELEDELLELKEYGFGYVFGKDYLEKLDGFDVIFRSPSILPNNSYLLKAQDNGAYVTSEIRELANYSKAKIIGITGSDGKTTTTTIISELLKEEGYTVWTGGNIGTPLFSHIEEIDMDDYVILELSSFQLMDFDVSPDISLITNLSPNHLDIHKDMAEYIDAKKNIFKHQDRNGLVVLNHDNKITASMIKETTCNVRTFSMNDTSTNAYCDEEKLYLDGIEVCNEKDIVIPGRHNVENFLAAFAVTKDIVSIGTLKKVVSSFKGVAHRIEFIRELDGVRYYNDSIASSPTRTLAGLKSFNKKVILIAGGYDKNIPFDILAKDGFDRIKSLVLIGQTAKKIKECFNEEMCGRDIAMDISAADSLEDAALKARNVAQKGDVVILSPACASFDMFKNFEARGNEFRGLVAKMK